MALSRSGHKIRPITDESLLRAALDTCPGQVRLEELEQVVPDHVRSRLRLREELAELELAGEVERLAIGEHIIYRVTEQFVEPDDGGHSCDLFVGVGRPWEQWVHRKRYRS